MPEEQTDGEARVCLYLAQTWFSGRNFAHVVHLMSSFLSLSFIWFPRPPHALPSEIPFSAPKRETQRMQKERWIPHLPSLPSFSPYIPSFTPLSPRLKASRFQGKRPHTKGERGEKKNHPAFCVFLTNGSCLSHCLPHSHSYTLRAVAISKSTAKYHMGPPHLPRYSPLLPTPHPLPTRVSE